jgi:hypothetical protein
MRYCYVCSDKILLFRICRETEISACVLLGSDHYYLILIDHLHTESGLCWYSRIVQDNESACIVYICIN